MLYWIIQTFIGVRKRDLTIYRENELFAVLLKVRRFAPRFSTPDFYLIFRNYLHHLILNHDNHIKQIAFEAPLFPLFPISYENLTIYNLKLL